MCSSDLTTMENIKQYETVFIMNPVLSDEQVKECAQKFVSLLKDQGAKIVFEGRCAGANRFEWSLHRDTTVPATLLPELGGEFAPGK